MKVIEVYTDGSAINNPGPAGIGIYSSKIKKGKKVFRNLSVGFVHATNNQMELLACLMAVVRSLKTITGDKQILIHTDSQYTIDAVTKWRSGWQRNRWINSSGEHVKNRDLIEVLGNLYDNKIIVFNKVKAHADNEGNNAADELACKASASALHAKPDPVPNNVVKLFKGVYDFAHYKLRVLDLPVLTDFR